MLNCSRGSKLTLSSQELTLYYVSVFFQAARDALDEIKASLNTIESAAKSADEIVKETPIELNVICPQIDPAQIEAELGIDLNQMVSLLGSEFQGLSEEVNRNVSTVGKLIDDIETGLYDFEDYVNHVDSLMWILPGLLFAVSLLAAISMLGVLLAWKEKSGRTFQRAMAYVVLPTLIVASIACWVVVLCASFGTMVSSDMCTAGDGPGSPDETIQQILSSHNLGQNDTIFKLVNAYTNVSTFCFFLSIEPKDQRFSPDIVSRIINCSAALDPTQRRM
jgi:hypothetical protein